MNKIIIKSLLFSVLLLFISCNNPAPKNTQIIEVPTQAEHFSIPDSTYSILEFKTEWQWLFKDAIPTTLQEEELIAIEKTINTAITENNKKEHLALNNYNAQNPNEPRTETGYELKIDGFYRQYVPVINNKGEKEVWINFLCGASQNMQQITDIIWVNDGGNCYFSIKVNLETNTYYALSINGYA